MKQPKRFTEAIKALRNAFFSKKLAAGNCMSCAVGNIVANAYGHEITEQEALEEWDEIPRIDGTSLTAWTGLKTI